MGRSGQSNTTLKIPLNFRVFGMRAAGTVLQSATKPVPLAWLKPLLPLLLRVTAESCLPPQNFGVQYKRELMNYQNTEGR